MTQRTCPVLPGASNTPATPKTWPCLSIPVCRELLSLTIAQTGTPHPFSSRQNLGILCIPRKCHLSGQPSRTPRTPSSTRFGYVICHTLYPTLPHQTGSEIISYSTSYNLIRQVAGVQQFHLLFVEQMSRWKKLVWLRNKFNGTCIGSLLSINITQKQLIGET